MIPVAFTVSFQALSGGDDGEEQVLRHGRSLGRGGSHSGGTRACATQAPFSHPGCRCSHPDHSHGVHRSQPAGCIDFAFYVILADEGADLPKRARETSRRVSDLRRFGAWRRGRAGLGDFTFYVHDERLPDHRCRAHEPPDRDGRPRASGLSRRIRKCQCAASSDLDHLSSYRRLLHDPVGHWQRAYLSADKSFSDHTSRFARCPDSTVGVRGPYRPHPRPRPWHLLRKPSSDTASEGLKREWELGH
jgi:hypothetical protein